MLEIYMDNKIHSMIIAFIYFLLPSRILSSPDDNVCGYNDEGKSVCCAYYYKLSGECIKCPLGSTGLRCDTRCHFPKYGELCLQMCNCSRKFCHFAYGCSNEIGKSSTAGFLITSQLSETTNTGNLTQNSFNISTTFRNEIQIDSDDQEPSMQTLTVTIISIGIVLILLLLARLVQKQLHANHNVRRRKHITNVTEENLDYYEIFDPNTRANDQTNYTNLQSNNEANGHDLSAGFNISIPTTHNESSRYSVSSKSSSAYTEIMT